MAEVSKTHVFISYARADEAEVVALAAALEGVNQRPTVTPHLAERKCQQLLRFPCLEGSHNWRRS